MSIEEQFNKCKRKKNKDKYYKYTQSVYSDAGKKDKSVNNDQWPIGTTVIVGYSTLNSIVEEKLSGQGCPVKRFPSSTVDDLSHCIILIIWKEPPNIIIHIGTNDAPSLMSREIQDNLLKLKSLVNKKLLQSKVWLSALTVCTDNRKATLTVSQVVNHLLNLSINGIGNRNIKNRHLSWKGLHLIDSESKLLPRNYLEQIKLFWVDTRVSSIIKDNELGYLLKDHC